MKKNIKNRINIIFVFFVLFIFFGQYQKNYRQPDVEWNEFLLENGVDHKSALNIEKASRILLSGCDYMTATIYAKLMKVGIDYSFKNDLQSSYLHQCQKGPVWKNIAENTLKVINIDNRDINGKTPWLVAVEKGNYEAANWLKQNNANINVTDNDGNNAWFLASDNLHEQMRMWNLDNADSKNDLLQNDLIYLIQKGNTKRAMLILKSAPDLEYRDKKGRTALHYAASKGYSDITQMIISRNLDLAYIEDLNHKTPYDLANSGAREILQQYVKKNNY